MRAVIADDEAPARDKLRRLLREHRDVCIVGEASTGPEAVRTVQALKPDLLLLDIRMPGLSGVSVVDAIRAEAESGPQVVFVTGYEAHAIEAFERQALDYLLKPYDGPRLAVALDRMRRYLTLERAGQPDTDRLLIKSDRRVFALDLRDVEWIESYGNYVCLHTVRGRLLKRCTIKELLDQLDPKRFSRIHRCAIVNLDRVRSLVPAMTGDQWLRVESGTRLRVSRAHRAEFVARWHRRCRMM